MTEWDISGDGEGSGSGEGEGDGEGEGGKVASRNPVVRASTSLEMLMDIETQIGLKKRTNAIRQASS